MADGISGELIPSRGEIEEQRTAHEIRVNRFAIAVLCVGVTAAAVGVLYYGALVALGISQFHFYRSRLQRSLRCRLG